jgi:hypothetical protein
VDLKFFKTKKYCSSAILVGNLAVGADILELLESLGDESLGVNEVAVYSILALWSLSLIIFGFEVPNDVLLKEGLTQCQVELFYDSF